MRSRKGVSGLTGIELLIIVAIILVICAIAIPGLLSSHRASNERMASTTLKTITSAEADFRANDRDWNHVNDFWTADVKGLYTMTAAAVPGAGLSPKDPPVRLIELPVAAADADGTLVSAGGENMPMSAFAPPAAKAGYWYAALLSDQSEGPAKAKPYKVDTGGTPAMGKCHNCERFGFAAFPDSSSAGKYVFIVNENNTIFRSATSVTPRLNKAVPPGIGGIAPVYLNWPDDRILLGDRPRWGGPLD